MTSPGELYAVKAAWCICSVKSCVIHAERFGSGVIHLRRYTNGIPLPFTFKPYDVSIRPDRRFRLSLSRIAFSQNLLWHRPMGDPKKWDPWLILFDNFGFSYTMVKKYTNF